MPYEVLNVCVALILGHTLEIHGTVVEKFQTIVINFVPSFKWSQSVSSILDVSSIFLYKLL
jgi:hypothetical protein